MHHVNLLCMICPDLHKLLLLPLTQLKRVAATCVRFYVVLLPGMLLIWLRTRWLLQLLLLLVMGLMVSLPCVLARVTTSKLRAAAATAAVLLVLKQA